MTAIRIAGFQFACAFFLTVNCQRCLALIDRNTICRCQLAAVAENEVNKSPTGDAAVDGDIGLDYILAIVKSGAAVGYRIGYCGFLLTVCINIIDR